MESLTNPDVTNATATLRLWMTDSVLAASPLYHTGPGHKSEDTTAWTNERDTDRTTRA